MSLFAYYAQYPDRLDAQRFIYGLHIDEQAFQVQVADDIRLTCAGGYRIRLLDEAGPDAIFCCCSFP